MSAAAPRAHGGTARRDSRLTKVGAAAGAGALVLLGLLPFGVNPAALSVVTLGLVYGLFTYGLDLSWGRAGLISVGQAAFFGVGAYAVAIAPGFGIPGPLFLVAGIAVSMALAAIMARIALSVTDEMAVPLFILLTLAVSQMLQRSASSLIDITGGTNGLPVRGMAVLPAYYLVLVVVVVVVAVTHRFVVRGRRGMRLLAVLSNPARAESLGVNARGSQVGGFVAAAAVSAIAGGLFAPVAGIVTPQALGLALSTAVLTWLAVGGKGSIVGPFVGAGLLTIAEQSLGGVWQSAYIIALAIAFIVVVSIAPSGLAGAVRSIARKGRDISRLPKVRPVAPVETEGVDGAPLLAVRNVDQRLGGALILQDVSLTIDDGQCVALIGPNGAGKSTLLGVIAGQLRPSRGTVELRGRDIGSLRVDQRARRRVGRLFQVPSVFSTLTVADNRRIASLLAGRDPGWPTGDGFGLEDDVTAGELSMAERRNLELDMVLLGPPELVLLDEPAAGLSHADARALAKRLRDTIATSGCSMLIVEHDMEIVREVADVVVVLAEGRVIAVGTMDEIVEHDAVRRAYLGGVA